MKNIKNYNEFVNEGVFRNFLTGHTTIHDRETSMKNFYNRLYSIESHIEPGVIFNREKIEQAAKKNNYRGEIIQKDLPNGKVMYVYIPGKTSFQGDSEEGSEPIPSLA